MRQMSDDEQPANRLRKELPDEVPPSRSTSADDPAGGVTGAAQGSATE